MSDLKRIGAYLRVSTNEQSSELQRREIGAFVESRGWRLEGVYEDVASGVTKDRPRLKELMSEARERKIDIVVVWKMDRFARSLKDLIVTLQELRELGVEFVSVKDQIDFTTSVGRLMFHIVGAFAEFEASLIRERVRAGLANAKSKGIRLGRPIRVDVDKICRLRSAGHSMSEIAKQLKITKSAVSKTLSKRRG